MHKQAILFFLLFITLSSCKKLRMMAEEKATTQIVSAEVSQPLDTPDALYNLLNDYRKTNANIYKTLLTGSSASILNGMAETDVDYMITNSNFGQFKNFDRNAEQFTSYTEIVCSLAEYHEGNAYKAAYDIWMKDEEIKKEIKNEYTLADANCQGYGNGWMCSLMLAAS